MLSNVREFGKSNSENYVFSMSIKENSDLDSTRGTAGTEEI